VNKSVAVVNTAMQAVKFANAEVNN